MTVVMLVTMVLIVHTKERKHITGTGVLGKEKGPSRTGGYARNDEARFAPSKRFLRFLHIARAIFEPGKFFQKGEGNFTHRPVALFGND